MKDFVHLHLHTDYSLLDGACPISWYKLKEDERKDKYDIIRMAKESGMNAVAITDHGVMGGCLEFHNALKKAGLKPLVGCETYVAPGSRLEKRPDIRHVRGYHLILLAKNNVGYKNLCSLISEAHMTGFYYKPRVDKELLRKYSEGLIATSACLQGEIDVACLNGGIAAGQKVLNEYLDIFGPENFYIELMYHGLDDQKRVNRDLLALAKSNHLKTVATNDVHYLRKEYARAHELMLCIQTRTTMNDESRMRMDVDEFYFKNGDEMYEVFGSEVPEALTNTLEVADRCDVSIGYENHYPEYHPPQEFLATLDLDAMAAEVRREIDEASVRPTKQEAAPIDLTPEQKETFFQKGMILKKAGAYLREICLHGTDGDNSVCGYKVKYGYDPFNPPPEKQEEAREYLARMEFELSVINRTKYPSYFLCVWDFINWAQKRGIPVGPGRGSGAGSIVAYLSGITDIDPMKYDLLFERFLNPDRVSPPDFDTDFCERNRQKVIDYVIDKYGAESVSQIGTYGTLKAKAVLKDVARALGRLPADGNRITKTVPDDPKMTLAKAIKDSPDLRALLEQEPWVGEVFGYSKTLEQLNRQMGIHACGVIICNQPLANLVPLGRGAHEEIITQYVAPLCESVGLLKMDFLGLRTLTVIQDACDNVLKNRGIRLDMDHLPLDDKPTFELLNNGDTVAVFQLESGGMQELCRKFGVETLKHIIALVAIYRPGPMQFIDLFVGRKKGVIPVEYDHPKMEHYLQETYGIMLYQEQIMQVVQVLAGFSLGQADILRRAIGKKKIDEMNAQRDKFIEGCAKTNDIPPDQSEKIWENIKKFADYGFNKSHSAAYALLSYRTAYLKANYRPEFMSAVLTSELSNAEKLAFLINECRSAGISILPPDVNSSDVNFTVDKGAIRFGLGAIKGFGQGVSASIIAARKDGPFKSLSDLVERTDGLNAKSLETLVRCGATDSLGLKRSQMVSIIEPSIQSALMRKRDKESGQGSLFDMLDDYEKESFGDVLAPDLPEFDTLEILNDEKHMLGFFVSGHPLSKYKSLVDAFSTATVADILAMPGDIGVKLGGMLTGVSRKFTKKDNREFAIFQLEDLTGSIECICYNKTYEQVKTLLVDGAFVFVRAVTKKNEGEDSPVVLQLDSPKPDQTPAVVPLPRVMETETREFHVHLFESETNREKLIRVGKAIRKCPGDARVILCIASADGATTAFLETDHKFDVCPTPEQVEYLESLLGPGTIRYKAKSDVPQPRPRFVRTEEPNPES